MFERFYHVCIQQKTLLCIFLYGIFVCNFLENDKMLPRMYKRKNATSPECFWGRCYVALDCLRTYSFNLDFTFTLTPLVSAVLVLPAEVLFDGRGDYFRDG